MAQVTHGPVWGRTPPGATRARVRAQNGKGTRLNAEGPQTPVSLPVTGSGPRCALAAGPGSVRTGVQGPRREDAERACSRVRCRRARAPSPRLRCSSGVTWGRGRHPAARAGQQGRSHRADRRGFIPLGRAHGRPRGLLTLASVTGSALSGSRATGSSSFTARPERESQARSLGPVCVGSRSAPGTAPGLSTCQPFRTPRPAAWRGARGAGFLPLASVLQS